MRDPRRIDTFCDRLAIAWKNVPDLRFGQFMCNVLGEFAHETKKDPFFPEEDELITYIENWADKNSPYRAGGVS